MAEDDKKPLLEPSASCDLLPPPEGSDDDEDAWVYDHRSNADEKPSSIPSAVFNMVNSILGAGIVGLPDAFAQAGVWLGWCLFIGMALLTCYTLEILIRVGHASCRRGDISTVAYEEITASALGENGRKAALIFQFLYCFGANVGYVVILKDSLSTALGNLSGASWFEDNETLVTLILSVCLLLPICLLRSVNSLASLSFVSFLAVVVIVAMVIYEFAAKRDSLCNTDVVPLPTPPNSSFADPPVACDVDYSTFGRSTSVNVLGVFVFAYMCHHNQFPVYRSMGEGAEPSSFSWITRSSILIASLVTGTSSAIIYATYGQTLDSDFFKTYPSSSNLINIGRLVFALTMVLSFPMQFIVAREVLQVVLLDYAENMKRHMISAQDVESKGSDTPREVMNLQERIAAAESRSQRHPSAPPVSSDESRQQSRQRMESGIGSVLASNASGLYVRPRASGLSTLTKNSSFSRAGKPLGRVSSKLDRPPSAKAMSAAGGGVRDKTSLRLHLISTVPLFVCMVALALAAKSLGSVLNLVGGLMGSALGFILPGVVNIVDAKQQGNPPFGGYFVSYATVCFGVLMAVLSVVTSVMDFAGVKIS